MNSQIRIDQFIKPNQISQNPQPKFSPHFHEIVKLLPWNFKRGENKNFNIIFFSTKTARIKNEIKKLKWNENVFFNCIFNITTVWIHCILVRVVVRAYLIYIKHIQIMGFSANITNNSNEPEKSIFSLHFTLPENWKWP